MIVKYRKTFKKQYNKLPKKIKLKFDSRFDVFFNNPFDKILKNHKLSWNFLWFNNIDITWDYRAIFKELSNWNYEFVEFFMFEHIVSYIDNF